jgi:hypothetical protein
MVASARSRDRVEMDISIESGLMDLASAFVGTPEPPVDETAV